MQKRYNILHLFRVFLNSKDVPARFKQYELFIAAKRIYIKTLRSDMLGRMKKMKRISLLLLVLLMLALSACGASDVKDDKSEEQEPKETTECYNRFSDVLSDFEYNIGSYNWNTDKKVAFSDIDKDGFDELFFIECNDAYAANFHVYKFNGTDAVECGYELFPGLDYPLVVSRLASGTQYLAFSSKSESAFYIVENINDGNYYTHIRKFSLKGETVSLEKDLYEKIESGSITYTLDDEDIDVSEAEKIISNFSKDFDKIVFQSPVAPAYDGRKVLPMFAKYSSKDTIALNYEDATKYLNSKISKK